MMKELGVKNRVVIDRENEIRTMFERSSYSDIGSFGVPEVPVALDDTGA